MDGLASLAGLTGWMGNAIFSYLIFHFYRERGTRAKIYMPWPYPEASAKFLGIFFV